MTGVEEDKMLTVRGTSRSSIWSSYKAIVRNSFVSIVDRMCDPFTTQIIRNQQKGAQVLFSQADAKQGEGDATTSTTPVASVRENSRWVRMDDLACAGSSHAARPHGT